MATWIVHLRIAENLLGMTKGLQPVQFAIGNIAPDSGIPDEKWETFNPPSEVTHFKNPDPNPWQLADLDFYRRYLATFQSQDEDAERFSFLWGYFLHLITDNLWDHEIFIPTRTQFVTEFEKDPDFGWEVKRDWYGLDFVYLRDHPNSLFQRIFLDCEYERDYLDFMPVEAVQQRIAYIKEFYQRQDEKIQALFERPFIYLSKKRMNSFVKNTTQRLYSLFDSLWMRYGNAPDSPTILEEDSNQGE